MKYRDARNICNDLVNCGPDEVANIARDLRLSPCELVILARNGSNAADLLQDLLNVLGLDKNAIENDELRDLKRLCTTCRGKRRCRLDLANV
jgi:hypothetical protein